MRLAELALARGVVSGQACEGCTLDVDEGRKGVRLGRLDQRQRIPKGRRDLGDGRGAFRGEEHASAREKGAVRSEGKEYVVQDGDVLLFRFNV